MRYRGRPWLLAAIAIQLSGATQAADSDVVLYEEVEVFASDAHADDWFGDHVALEGGRLVVGARLDDDHGEGSGSAYVFERDENGLWLERAKLTASDGDVGDQFTTVALSGDTIVVGAEFEDEIGFQAGAAYVFERDADGIWTESMKLVASDGGEGDNFGESVAIDGDTIVVGAHEHDSPLGERSGGVWVFERSEVGTWIETAKLLASDGGPTDWFGSGVAIDGGTILVGARGVDDQGVNAGAAYVFDRDEDGAWMEMAKLQASDGEAGDIFGAIGELDGGTIALGAAFSDDQGEGSGSAYVFERDESGAWVETAKLLSPDGSSFDVFGIVAVDGDLIVVGAYGGRSQPGIQSGTADLFRRESGTWSHAARLLPSEGRDLDQFGIRVAIDGETVVAGARLDDDLGEDSGSVYVYELEECVLRLQVEPEIVRAGEELRVGILLEHNRPDTVTVPFRVWIEDSEGGLVASRTTEPQTFHHGDTVRRELTLQIPEGTPPGEYRVFVGAERMQQGLAGAERSFTVLGPAPPTLVPPSR